VTYHSDTLRRSHRSLREVASCLCAEATTIHAASHAEREERIAELLRRIRRDVLPHLDHDEQALYSHIHARAGDSLAIESMKFDREAIGRWVDRLARESLENGELGCILCGLAALLTVYIDKEERLFLPMLEAVPWSA
jgi:iron-sulfur cluster repair protein YtfE (RIC family)